MLIETTPEAKQRLDVLRLIVCALILGVVIFAVVTLYAAPAQTLDPKVALMLRVAWVAVAVGQVAMIYVMSRMGLNAAKQQAGDQSALMRYFYANTLVGAALGEGLALFGTIIAWLSAQQYDYALAGAGVLLLVLQFPTSNRWESFVRRATGQDSWAV